MLQAHASEHTRNMHFTVWENRPTASGIQQNPGQRHIWKHYKLSPEHNVLNADLLLLTSQMKPTITEGRTQTCRSSCTELLSPVTSFAQSPI